MVPLVLVLPPVYMRALIILLFGGVLWGTPIIVSETSPDSLAAEEFLAIPTAPDSDLGLEHSLESTDALGVMGPQGVKQAFLAGYPLGVTIGQLQVAAGASVIAVPRGNWDDVVLSSVGGMLAAGMALYALLLLVGLLIEMVRTRAAVLSGPVPVVNRVTAPTRARLSS